MLISLYVIAENVIHVKIILLFTCKSDIEQLLNCVTEQVFETHLQQLTQDVENLIHLLKFQRKRVPDFERTL